MAVPLLRIPPLPGGLPVSARVSRARPHASITSSPQNSRTFIGKGKASSSPWPTNGTCTRYICRVMALRKWIAGPARLSRLSPTASSLRARKSTVAHAKASKFAPACRTKNSVICNISR